jgi:ATP-dependent DNA helicase Rep/DNA helicase-2/ATP-dependent DNA helicase PcrA
LTISRCLTRRTYGAVEERLPSRFLAEIPEQLLNAPGGDTAGNGEPVDLAADFFKTMLGE